MGRFKNQRARMPKRASAHVAADGRRWKQYSDQIERLESDRDDVATELERAANAIANHMYTPSHRRAMFTRTTESARLTGYEGGVFTFEVYDHYENERGMSFTLTLDALADPEATIEELKAETRAHELREAEEAVERANARLAKVQS